jgi:hypothetical protein
MMKFWLLYYAIFGPKYTRLALVFTALGMAFFFFCFVHGAFDSHQSEHSIAAPFRPQPIRVGLPPGR